MSTNHRVLIVTPEVTYLPTVMGGQSDGLNAKAGGLADVSAALINARYGLDWSTDDFVNLGVSVLQTEYSFNRKAGFTKADDRLPDMFRETLPPHETTWDFTNEKLQQVKQLESGDR